MDRPEIEALIRQLKSPDERQRLSAVSELARETSELAKMALPSLKDSFLYDPNPAVKYLARKALANQGIDTDSLLRGEGLPSDVEAPNSSGQGVLAFQGGVRAFWRAAQTSLWPSYNALCRLVSEFPDQVVPLVLEQGDDLALDILQPHLCERFVAVHGDPGHAAIARMAEVAQGWHTNPRQPRYPERGDVKGSASNQAARILVERGTPAQAALALRAVSTRDQPTADLIVSKLEEPEGYLAWAAVEALADIGRAKRELALKILMAAMRHFRPGAEQGKLLAIARLTGWLANPASIEFIKTHIKTTEGPVRGALVDALGRFNIPMERKEGVIAPMLKDPDPTVVVRGMACLWGGSQQPFMTYLMSRLINHSDPAARRALARALGDIGKPEVVGYLMSLARDPHEAVRQEAARALVRLEGEGLEARFTTALSEGDPRVQAAALGWLVEHAGKEVLDRLRQGITSSDTAVAVKVACAEGLARVGAKVDAVDLSVQLQMDDQTVKVRVLEALAALNEPRVTKLVERMLLDRSPPVRGLAAQAMWTFGEMWVADNVRDLLDSHDPVSWEAGIQTLAVLTTASRSEMQLLARPLLRTALRQSPAFSVSGKADRPGGPERRGPPGWR